MISICVCADISPRKLLFSLLLENLLDQRIPKMFYLILKTKSLSVMLASRRGMDRSILKSFTSTKTLANAILAPSVV